MRQIVEVMGESVSKLVITERFQARIGADRAEMRKEIRRSYLVLAGVIVAANAQMWATVFVLLVCHGLQSGQ